MQMTQIIQMTHIANLFLKPVNGPSMQGVPDHGWARMTFEEYLPWYLSYTWLHVQLAGALGKPMLQEEFNIISRYDDSITMATVYRDGATIVLRLHELLISRDDPHCVISVS